MLGLWFLLMLMLCLLGFFLLYCLLLLWLLAAIVLIELEKVSCQILQVVDLMVTGHWSIDRLSILYLYFFFIMSCKFGIYSKNYHFIIKSNRLDEREQF